MRSSVLAVDLGKHCSGVAVYLHGILVHATEITTAPLAATMAAGVVGVFVEHCGVDLDACEPELVFERMKHYRGKGARTRDLDHLTSIGRHLRQHWAWSTMSRAYTAQQWKGSVPKHIHHARMRELLKPEELDAIEVQGKEAWDAIGLGLYHLGRMGRGSSQARHRRRH